jgi:hypothetical protein
MMFSLSSTDTQSLHIMSELSFGKLVVPALLTTGAVFTALSAPVVMFAETPLNISQGKAQLYDGTVRDAALPYLMLAGVTSVGLGISGVAMAGWRKSAKRADALGEAIDSQQQRRLDREAHLKASLASEQYLVKSGLDFFLEDGELTPFVPERLPMSEPLPIQVHRPAIALESVTERPRLPEAPRQLSREARDMMTQLAWLDGEDVVLPAVADRPEGVIPVARPLAPSMPVVRPSQTTPLAVAQGFYGFSRGTEAAHVTAPTAAGQTVVQDQMTIARIQSLQTQLQAIVTQIESLQANLPLHPATMQIVEEVPLAQSGLVQQEFKPQSQVELNRSEHVQTLHRVAS